MSREAEQVMQRRRQDLEASLEGDVLGGSTQTFDDHDRVTPAAEDELGSSDFDQEGPLPAMQNAVQKAVNLSQKLLLYQFNDQEGQVPSYIGCVHSMFLGYPSFVSGALCTEVQPYNCQI